MKTRAVSMVLLMIASALAGCTSGDPDGDGEMGIDTDMLNDLIEDNLQDFINNTSVTVHQEIHYHNNTTVVNNYDETNNEYLNTTNVEGQDVTNHYANNYSYGGIGGGNGSASNLYLLDIQFNLSTLMPDGEVIDYRNNTIDYEYQYYDYLTNSERTDIFTIQCSDYYLIGSQSENSSFVVSYWQDNSNYWDAWIDQNNQTIANMLQDAGYNSEVRETCDENYNTGAGDYDNLLLFEIPIPAGVAILGDLADGQNEYVWYYEDSRRYYDHSTNDNYDTYLDIIDDEMGWQERYYPNERDPQYWDSFSVQYEFETMDLWYSNMGLTGGDADTVLSVYVNNIFPDYEYRLVVYFEMSSVVPLE